MQIDWTKWEAIELEQNRLNASVDFLKERLQIATLNTRNVEAALLRAVGSHGLFRSRDRGDFMQAAKADTQACLDRHIGHPIESILRQYHEAKLTQQKAADSLAQAESARNQHGQSYHKLRRWIQEQQSRGVLA